MPHLHNVWQKYVFDILCMFFDVYYTFQENVSLVLLVKITFTASEICMS